MKRLIALSLASLSLSWCGRLENSSSYKSDPQKAPIENKNKAQKKNTETRLNFLKFIARFDEAVAKNKELFFFRGKLVLTEETKERSAYGGLKQTIQDP